MYIKVIAHPLSKKELIEEKKPGTLEIWLREPAERNLANKKIVELVAEFAHVTAGKVRIISGHTSPRKMLSINE